MNDCRRLGKSMAQCFLKGRPSIGGLAAVVVVGFLVVHALGWRTDTTVLSGTLPDGDGSPEAAILRGACYAGLYFGTVVFAPIVAIATLLMRAWDRFAVARQVP